MNNKDESTFRGGGLFTLCLVVAALYFAHEVFVPLALAILFAFLLTPLANVLERLRIGRMAAGLIAVISALVTVSALCYFIVGQLAAFGKELPKYEKNIHEKVRAFEARDVGIFGHFAKSFQDFRNDLSATNVVAATNAVASGTTNNTAKPPEPKPVPVEVKNSESSTVQILQKIIQPSLNFTVSLFLVTVFCVFILAGRNDLRARVLRIVGKRNAKMTNELLDDTGHRVGRYLMMQLVVNVTYGGCVGLALWAIGIPNPLLWGVISGLFRYIPYAGPWIAASLPLTVAFAISTNWAKPAMVLGLYGVVEIVTANLLEPFLYGNSTGITPLSVLLAAVFWTWLWGPIGLLLSVPLTVCLVSIARYVPEMEMLDQLFGESKSDSAH